METSFTGKTPIIYYQPDEKTIKGKEEDKKEIKEEVYISRRNRISPNMPFGNRSILNFAMNALYNVLQFMETENSLKNRAPDFYLYVTQGNFDKANDILKDDPQALNEIWKGKKIVHYIVDQNKKESIEYLNGKNADFNALDSNKRSPIFIAACINKLIALETIATLANTDLTFIHETSKNTVFHIVAKKNYVEACSILVKQAQKKNMLSAVINEMDKAKKTALIISFEKKNFKIFELLVDTNEINLATRQPITKKTILHLLAEKNKVVEFNKAIDRLAIQGNLTNVINLTDKSERTALFIAAERNNFLIAKKLIEAGASFSSPPTEKSPYQAAPSIKFRSETKTYLWDVMHGNIEIDLGSPQENAAALSRALVLCINELNFEQAKKLLHKGVSPESIDSNDNTLSMLVIKSNKLESEKLELIKLLREKGDLVNKSNANGESLLILATQNGHESIVKELIVISAKQSQNIDVNYQDRLGNTALHYAVETGNYNVTESLLEYALINIRNNNGQTALHKVNDEKLVALLTRGGADPSISDHLGRRPISFIAMTDSYNPACMALLSADPNNGIHKIAKIQGNNELEVLTADHVKHQGKQKKTSTDSDKEELITTSHTELDSIDKGGKEEELVSIKLLE